MRGALAHDPLKRDRFTVSFLRWSMIFWKKAVSTFPDHALTGDGLRGSVARRLRR
jgi:hypothetical protein